MDTTTGEVYEEDHFEDGAEEETTERRHRRDFVGTELERPKKNSRQRNRKRHRAGLDLNEDNDMGQSSAMVSDETNERTVAELVRIALIARDVVISHLNHDLEALWIDF